MYHQENISLMFGGKGQENAPGGWRAFQRRKRRNHPRQCLPSRDEDPAEAAFDRPIDEIASGISGPVNERGG